MPADADLSRCAQRLDLSALWLIVPFCLRQVVVRKKTFPEHLPRMGGLAETDSPFHPASRSRTHILIRLDTPRPFRRASAWSSSTVESSSRTGTTRSFRH